MINWSRRILIASLLGSGAALSLQNAFARTISGSMPWTPGYTVMPPFFQGARFFTDSERRCVSAMVERLIPSDELGPGAREANVIDFIDDQLAGFYGRGDRWYMQGPFHEGTKQQGYQFSEPPRGLYRRGVVALNKVCHDEYGGRPFADLDAATQDAILKRLDADEIKLDGTPARTFFRLVLENAIEGFFCDPLYGGNHNMVGWRLVGFPGARYDYRTYLNHNGGRIELEPVGLKGGPTWNQR